MGTPGVAGRSGRVLGGGSRVEGSLVGGSQVEGSGGEVGEGEERGGSP